MAEASDFKIGLQLGFTEAYHKISPLGNSRFGIGLGKLPKVLGCSYNISAMAGASNFKIGTQLGFAKAHHKIPHRKDVALGYIEAL